VSSSRGTVTSCGESRKITEATGQSTFLSTKHIIMESETHYKLALLGISVTRWPLTGQRRISIGELLLFPEQKKRCVHAIKSGREPIGRMGSAWIANHQKDWIIAETWRRIEVRKENKSAVNNSRTRVATAHDEHTEANREVKMRVNMNKRNFINSLAKEAEQGAGSGNMRELYDTTNKLAGKYCKQERSVQEKE